MTDKELIEMLRAGPEIVYRYVSVDHAAADRIEQLVEQRSNLVQAQESLVDTLSESGRKRKDAEAKLARAVEALRFTDDGANAGVMTSTYGESALRSILRGIRERARAVLAELEKTE